AQRLAGSPAQLPGGVGGQHDLGRRVRGGQPAGGQEAGRERGRLVGRRRREEGRLGGRAPVVHRALNGDLAVGVAHVRQAAERVQRRLVEGLVLGGLSEVVLDGYVLELAALAKLVDQGVLQTGGQRQDQRHRRDPDRDPAGGETGAQLP